MAAKHKSVRTTLGLFVLAVGVAYVHSDAFLALNSNPSINSLIIRERIAIGLTVLLMWATTILLKRMGSRRLAGGPKSWSETLVFSVALELGLLLAEWKTLFSYLSFHPQKAAYMLVVSTVSAFALSLFLWTIENRSGLGKQGRSSMV